MYAQLEMLLCPGEILGCSRGVSECCASREVLVSFGKMTGCPVEMPCYPKEFLGTSREMLIYCLDKPGCSKEMLDAPETCGVPK